MSDTPVDREDRPVMAAEAAIREWAEDAAAFATWLTPERRERFFGPGGPGELRVTGDGLDPECDSCPHMPQGECPKSLRPCGHHCNHSWDQDQCCWCGTEFGENGTETHG